MAPWLNITRCPLSACCIGACRTVSVDGRKGICYYINGVYHSQSWQYNNHPVYARDLDPMEALVAQATRMFLFWVAPTLANDAFWSIASNVSDVIGCAVARSSAPLPNLVTTFWEADQGDGALVPDEAIGVGCADNVTTTCATFDTDQCGIGEVLRANFKTIVCKHARCAAKECCEAGPCAKYALEDCPVDTTLVNQPVSSCDPSRGCSKDACCLPVCNLVEMKGLIGQSGDLNGFYRLASGNRTNGRPYYVGQMYGVPLYLFSSSPNPSWKIGFELFTTVVFAFTESNAPVPYRISSPWSVTMSRDYFHLDYNARVVCSVEPQPCIGEYIPITNCSKSCGGGGRMTQVFRMEWPALNGGKCPKSRISVPCNTHSCDACTSLVVQGFPERLASLNTLYRYSGNYYDGRPYYVEAIPSKKPVLIYYRSQSGRWYFGTELGLTYVFADLESTVAEPYLEYSQWWYVSAAGAWVKNASVSVSCPSVEGKARHCRLPNLIPKGYKTIKGLCSGLTSEPRCRGVTCAVGYEGIATVACKTNGTSFTLSGCLPSNRTNGICPTVLIQGRNGLNAEINGEYKYTGRFLNQRPVYLQSANMLYLFWYPYVGTEMAGCWKIDEPLGTEAYRAELCEDVADPSLGVGIWEVYNGLADPPDRLVTVECLD